MNAIDYVVNGDKTVEFKLGESFILKLTTSKDLELINTQNPDIIMGTYPLNKYRGKFKLNKRDIESISLTTDFSDKKITSVVTKASNYILENIMDFRNSTKLNTFYIPPEAHQEDVMRATRFFIEDNVVFADEDTTDNNNVVRYVYDERYNKFVELTPFKLGEYIANKYDFYILREDASKVIDGIYNMAKSNLNYIQFNNGFYNISTHELESEPVFTHNIINHNYVPLESCPQNTLIEKTLKEILIPKSNPEDTKLYDTVLYYLGSALLGVKPKVIVVFYDKGNGGKTVIMRIISDLFGNMNITLKENELTDKFSQVALGDKCTILLDELSKSAFVDVDTRAIVKDISGNGDFKVRVIRTDTMKTVENTGLVMMASNYLPEVDNSDTAYYERLQFLIPPNTFKTSIDDDEVDENVYLANPSILSDIREDESGFVWLISKCIDTFLNRDLDEFYQNADKTLMLVNGNDIISNFISTYVIPLEGNNVSNKCLTYYFMKYCLSCGFNYTDVEDVDNIQNLRIKLGGVMKRNGYHKNNTRPVLYYNCDIHLDFKDDGVFTDDDFRLVENKFFCLE